MRIVAILALLMLAGCTDAEDYKMGGAFTSDRSQADLEEFNQLVGQYSDDVAIMESFPEQFSIRGMNQADCEELYTKLQAKSYISSLNVCTLDHE